MSVGVEINRTGSWRIPRRLLERGIRAAASSQGVREGEMSLTFLDDQGIRSLNREYLGRDRPTDVIAFTLHRPGEPVLGDVYVGFEQAKRQAREAGVRLREELLRLSIHGVLHVLGHDHPDSGERESSPMFLLQEELVRAVLGEEEG